MPEQRVHTTEDTESLGNEGVLASLGLNGQLFVFQLINFTLVAVIVWFLILKPLTKKMDERKKLVDESLDKAKEIETNLAMSEQKFQDRIDDAKVEANRIIAKAGDEAMETANVLKKKAKAEIELLVSQAKKNIEIDRDDMRQSLKKETVDLVVASVEKILKEKLDGKKDMELIKNTLTEVK